MKILTVSGTGLCDGPLRREAVREREKLDDERLRRRVRHHQLCRRLHRQVLARSFAGLAII